MTFSVRNIGGDEISDCEAPSELDAAAAAGGIES